MTDPRSSATVVALGPLNPVIDKLGRPVHDLRISVMDRCNFRCPYCMPQSTFDDKYRFLRAQERLSFEEIVRLARVAARLGVRKVRLTGGEPLLRSGLPDLVAELSGIEGIEDLALTTNGVLLAQHAAKLKGNGLHRVTVSLDSLDEAVFTRMSGGFGGLPQVLDGIEAALAAGLRPVKVNTVVQRGLNDHTVLDLLDRFRGTGVTVRLIEYMDVGNRNHWEPAQVVPSADILRQVRSRWPVTAAAGRYRGRSHRVTRTTMAPVKSASCRRSASRSAATAIAHACPRKACCTRASSPRAGSTCARHCAPAPRIPNCSS